MARNSALFARELIASLLAAGYHVRIRALGSSMEPAIAGGSIVELAPVDVDQVRANDVIAYRGSGGLRLHRVREVARYPLEPAASRPIASPAAAMFYCRGDSLPLDDPPVAATEVLGRAAAVFPPPAAALTWRRAARALCQRIRRGWFSDLRPGQRGRAALLVLAATLIAGGTARSQIATPTDRLAWTLASAGAIKVQVTTPGWVRVTGAELARAGLAAEVDPRRLGAYRQGQEVALLVIGGEDGRLDPSDAIEFYGFPPDTALAGTGVYWLLPDVDHPRRVAPPLPPQSSAAQESSRFADDGSSASMDGVSLATALPRQTYAIAETRKPFRSLYLAAVQNGALENFFGPVVSAEGFAEALLVDELHRDADTPARLSVTVQGATRGVHRLRVSLGGHELGEMVFEHAVSRTETFELPPTRLLEGANAVRLVRSSGSASDVVLVDTLALAYPRALRARSDALSFVATRQAVATVTGFSSAAVRVFDITDPDRPTWVPATVAGTPPAVSVTVTEPAARDRTLLAIADPAVRAPAATFRDAPSAWHASNHRQGLVMIAHASLLEAAARLVSQREREGMAVALVDVQDVYDEFSFGVRESNAIRSFLVRARAAWDSPPRFLLLLGDASFDGRNRLGAGDFDLVPTHYVATRQLETASDDWFVDDDEDGVPEIAVGRLPARTPDELTLMLHKGLARQPLATTEPLSGLLLSDAPVGYAFAEGSRLAAAAAGAGLSATYLTRAGTDKGTWPSFAAALSRAPALVSYFGHGSTQVWANNSLAAHTVPTLPITSVFPIYLNITCLNGYFHDPLHESLAEALLRTPERGAAAVWASSGLTDPDRQAPLFTAALRYLVQDKLPLGDATRLAKTHVVDADVRRTWVLLGDPTIRLWDAPAPRDAGPDASAGDAAVGTDGGLPSADAGSPAADAAGSPLGHRGTGGCAIVAGPTGEETPPQLAWMFLLCHLLRSGSRRRERLRSSASASPNATAGASAPPGDLRAPAPAAAMPHPPADG